MVVETSTIAGWVVAPLLSAVVGYLAAAARGLAKRGSEHSEAMQQGMRALLRQQLIDYHDKYVVGGAACPVSVKEQATSVYNAYHGLGGNGTGTQLYTEIMARHVKED